MHAWYRSVFYNVTYKASSFFVICRLSKYPISKRSLILQISSVVLKRWRIANNFSLLFEYGRFGRFVAS